MKTLKASVSGSSHTHSTRLTRLRVDLRTHAKIHASKAHANERPASRRVHSTARVPRKRGRRRERLPIGHGREDLPTRPRARRHYWALHKQARGDLSVPCTTRQLHHHTEHLRRQPRG